MRFVIFIAVFLLVIIFSPKAYSLDYYFDFLLPFNTLTDGQEVVATFSWDIKGFVFENQKRFTVKPIISAGLVEIYNENTQTFVGITDFSSALPYLRKEMRLRFKGVQGSESPFEMYFVIYDTLNGNQYETARKKVWGTAYYKKYTEMLNTNILGVSGEPIVEVSSRELDEIKDPWQIHLWYFAPAFFVYGLLKLPYGYG